MSEQTNGVKSLRKAVGEFCGEGMRTGSYEAYRLLTAVEDLLVPVYGGSVELVQAAEGNAYLLRMRNSPKALGSLLEEINRSEISLEHLEVTPVTLEDVFLELTGNELRD